MSWVSASGNENPLDVSPYVTRIGELVVQATVSSEQIDIRSFLGKQGVFLPTQALLQAVVDLVTEQTLPPGRIDSINSTLRSDRFLDQAAEIDLREPKSLVRLPASILRWAINELVAEATPALRKRVLGQLEVVLADLNAHERRIVNRNRLSLIAAACFSVGALEIAGRDDEEQIQAPTRSLMSERAALLSYLGEAVMPPCDRIISREEELYVYNRDSRELLFKSRDIKPVVVEHNRRIYDATLSDGSTRRLTSDDVIISTHEALRWIDGPLEVYHNETGSLLYRAEMAALGTTSSEKREMCISFYVPKSECAHARTNILDGRALEEVIIVTPAGILWDGSQITSSKQEREGAAFGREAVDKIGIYPNFTE